MKNILLKKIVKTLLIGGFFCQMGMVKGADDLVLNRGASSSYVPPLLREISYVTDKKYSCLEDYVTYFSASTDKLIAPLKLGKELFERVLLMEEMVKNSGWEIWWRVTPNQIVDDFFGDQEASFGVSLLAGYMRDGWKNFGEAEFLGSNNSACAYVYYANALFAQDILNKRCNLIKKWGAFIEKNSFLRGNISIQKNLKDIHGKLVERCNILASFTELNQRAEQMRDQKITALGENPQNSSFQKESDFYKELKNQIQKDEEYAWDLHGDAFDTLSSEVRKIYGSENKVTESALCNLYAVLIPSSEVKRFLKLNINKNVKKGKDAVVEGKGGAFHPRLPRNEYKKLKENIISVYSNFSLIGSEQLKQNVKSIMEKKEKSLSDSNDKYEELIASEKITEKEISKEKYEEILKTMKEAGEELLLTDY